MAPNREGFFLGVLLGVIVVALLAASGWGRIIAEPAVVALLPDGGQYRGDMIEGLFEPRKIS